ncbi:hypothetical protein PR048_027849 [Dryococelus australis]|uniref:Uncharacterized protein n=1 Tax=Dryococelus australis TaxID=614101 RepID=A0ABQ9GHP8_9NEOP|nr:hypothetical protein PR048_027849 [Dryococelus australis]
MKKRDPYLLSLSLGRNEIHLKRAVNLQEAVSSISQKFTLIAFHQSEPGSIPGRVTPGFSHVGIVPDDAADLRVFLGISCFPALSFRCCSILTSVALIVSQYFARLIRLPAYHGQSVLEKLNSDWLTRVADSRHTKTSCQYWNEDSRFAHRILESGLRVNIFAEKQVLLFPSGWAVGWRVGYREMIDERFSNMLLASDVILRACAARVRTRSRYFTSVLLSALRYQYRMDKISSKYVVLLRSQQAAHRGEHPRVPDNGIQGDMRCLVGYQLARRVGKRKEASGASIKGETSQGERRDVTRPPRRRPGPRRRLRGAASV